MKITIEIGQKTAKHIRKPHSFYECCGEAEIVLKKVQREIEKQFEGKGKSLGGNHG